MAFERSKKNFTTNDSKKSVNKKLPYEELMDEQLQELPVPDQEQAWEKMKLLLEKDDDDRIVPPIFLRGCFGWTLSLLLILAIFWFTLHPEKWFRKDSISKREKIKQVKQEKTSVDSVQIHQTSIDGSSNPEVRGSTINKSHTDSSQQSGTLTTGEPNTSIEKNIAKQNRANELATANTARSKTAKNSSGKSRKKTKKNPAPKAVIISPAIVRNNNHPQSEKNIIQNKDDESPQKKPTKDSVTAVQKKTDTLAKKDTARKTDPVVSTPQKNDAKKTKNYFWSAGIGMQQLIPIAGQSATPYNYYGRTGSVADYLPSIYARFSRENKWYVQGEFRYGAPQAVKDISYEQFVIHDTANQRTTTITSRVKKTFYHQFPLSFNYQVLPRLTVGTGVMYSIFHGAVAEREIIDQVNQTTTITKSIIPIHRTDTTSGPSGGSSGGYSAGYFKNSQIHFLFQTDYELKKFSFSLRYALGLEPFIRYTDSSGALLEEKNQSLQFAVRYRLWKSKK
jgi:hypothetical protein